MKNELITTIEQAMLKKLDNAGLQALHEVLVQAFKGVSVTAVADADKAPDNTEILEEFLSAKRIEGCSEKSLNYYRKTITAALDSIGKGIKHITTDDLRAYLTDYQAEKKSSKVTMDNIRRILSSFFSWLEDEDYTRKTIILLTETPARIPEGLPAVSLTIDEGITWSDVKELQRFSGEFDYSLINFFYKNQYATNSLVDDALKNLRMLGIEKNIDYPSSSAKMSLATAWLLKKTGIVTDDEFNSIFVWLTSKEHTVASSSEALCQEVGNIGSDAICRRELQAAWQDGQNPSWNPSKFFVSNDGKCNFTPELFRQKITSKMKGTDSFNKSCQALEKRGLSYPTRTGEHTRTLTVKCEGGRTIKRKFISLSPELFSVEARQIVEKSLISDTFVEYKNCPRQFNPLIKHTQYDLLAGQLIGAYSTINPFVLITGSPGLGKSDMLMMQAVIKSDSGDTVFIYDQTNAFCRFEWAAHMVPPEIIDRIVFWDLSTMGWPIDLLDFRGCESHEQKVQRLSSLLKSGAHLTGPNQLSLLQKAVDNIISSYEIGNHDIKKAIERSLKATGKEGEVRQRLITMFSSVARNIRTPYDWEELIAMRGKIIVFSAGNAVVKPDANPLDMILDSFYGFKDKHRDKNVTLIRTPKQRVRDSLKIFDDFMYGVIRDTHTEKTDGAA